VSDTSIDRSADHGDASHDPRPTRRVPALVWWITALHITLLLAYSVLAPTFRAPDEPQHVDLAHLFSENFDYPAWDDRDTGSGILNALGIVQFHTKSMHLEASAAPPKDDRPSINELEDPNRPREINLLPEHPPLYYAIAGTLERGVEAITGDPIGAFDFETWFYRLVSILMVAPLPLIIWRIAERLGLPQPVGIAATLFPLGVPQYLHIGSAVNNDNLMILFFWLLTPLVIRIADGAVRPRTVGLAGMVTGLGLYSKGFAIVMPAWVLAALFVTLRRGGRERLRQVIVAALTYAVVAIAAGGWWWIANLVRYGRFMPTRYGDLVQPIESDARDYGLFLKTWGSLTTRRFWGDFGWFDVHIPVGAVIAATVVVMLGLVAACIRRDHVANVPFGNRLLLAAPIVLLVAVQFRNALVGYIGLGRTPGLQGRYWFGALAALAVIVMLGLANIGRRLVRWLPLGVLAGVVVMNALAAWTMLGFYWGPPDSAITVRVRAVVAWAPIEGEVLVVGAAIGSLVLVSTVVQLLGTTLRPPTPPEEPPPGPPSRTLAERVPARTAAY
jgi:small subunit ribosomal protein S36